MTGGLRVVTAAAFVAALAVGPGTSTAVAAATTPTGAVAGTVAVAAPAQAVASGVQEAVRRISRCSAWRFVPPDRTTCLASTTASIRVRTAAGRYLAWSAPARRWVPIAYRWSTVARGLVLDARLLVVRAPAAGRTHTVWRYRCQDWTLTPQGATTCRAGTAEQVRARLDAAAGPARVQSGSRYVTTAYRWSTAGGFLALDARLLPPPVPATATVALGGTVSPAFDPATTDYVTRCEADGPVAVTATTTGAARVSLDGAPAATGIDADVALAPGQSLHVDVSGTSAPVRYVVRCLPADFPVLTANGVVEGDADFLAISSGPFFGAGAHYAVVTDRHGTPVWWYRGEKYLMDVKPWPGGAVVWATGGAAQVHSLAGQLERVVPDIDGHDVLALPDGHALALRYVSRHCPAVPSEPPSLDDCVDLSPWGGPARAEVTDGEIVEVDGSGAVVWTWRSRDHIDLAESARWLTGGTAYLFDTWDLVHLNSLELDGDGIVVSARHLDAVYRLDRESGEVTWKLGGTPRPESLTAPAATFGGQHDARVLPGGDVTLFDNQTDRPGPPRSMRFSLDLQARTATLEESVVDPDVPASMCCGNTRRLAGGEWVTAWGGTPTVAAYGTTGQRVFRLDLPVADFSYRVEPVRSGTWTLASLRAGMDAMHPRS